jgi:hypothetical protein
MTVRLAAIAALLLPALLPASAMAAAATAAQNVNMRSGPATTFSVVGQLQQGDAVDVRQCEGDFCEVNGLGKTGWVKATYLTRDAVQKPAAPQIAAAPDAADLLPLDSAHPAPEMAIQDDLPSASFPPAYDAASPAPRPKASIPATIPEARDDYAEAAPFADDPVPSVGDDWSWRGPRMGRFAPRGPASMRGAYADYSPSGDARACFLDEAGRLAFCLRDGEGMQLPLRWEGHALSLRNPQGLDVSVCTVGDRDCQVIVADGPIAIDRPIATISVSAPGY